MEKIGFCCYVRNEEACGVSVCVFLLRITKKIQVKTSSLFQMVSFVFVRIRVLKLVKCTLKVRICVTFRVLSHTGRVYEKGAY